MIIAIIIGREKETREKKIATTTMATGHRLDGKNNNISQT